MSSDENYNGTDDIVCPYCLHTHYDSCREFAREGSFDFECHNCKQYFSCERRITIRYYSTPIEN